MRKQEEERWKIDKRIPLAVIITLLVQLAGTLIWATQLDARVNHIEQQSTGNYSLNERFGRLEERLDNVKQDTDALKRLLAQLTERLIKP